MDTFDLYLEKDSISLYLPDNGYESNHHSLSTTKTNILNLDHTISMYYHSFPIFLSISSNESHILYKKIVDTENLFQKSIDVHTFLIEKERLHSTFHLHTNVLFNPFYASLHQCQKINIPHQQDLPIDIRTFSPLKNKNLYNS